MKKIIFLILLVTQNCFSQNTKILFDPSDNFDGGFKNPNDFYINLVSALICFITPYFIAKNKFGDDASLTYWKWWFILVATSMLTALILRDYTITLIALIFVGFFGVNITKTDISSQNQEKLSINSEEFVGKNNESENLVTRNASNKEIYEVNLTSKEFLTKKARKEVQKTKIIYCPNCAQRLKLNVVVNTELEITCPSCRSNWIGTFKVLK